MIKFEFLPASNGDCIFISLDDEKFIIIDGGYATTYSKFLNKKLKVIQQNNKKLDLVVATHVDSDHIRGVLKLLGGEYVNLVRKVWFNSGEMLSKYFDSNFTQEKIDLIETQNGSKNIGISEGIKLESRLRELSISNIEPIKSLSCNSDDVENVKFTFISPNEEKLKLLDKEWNKVLENELNKDSSSNIASRQNDYDKTIDELLQNSFISDESIANGSSIAFIMKCASLELLFLADAHMNIVIGSLKGLGYSNDNPLKVEFVKLSHHGSKNNLNEEFLSLIDTDTYIISTNGSPKHHHPNKETLAKIIDFHKRKAQACKFIFNYPKDGPLKEIFMELDFKQINDSFFHIEYNEEYNFYLKFPKKSNTGAVLKYE